MAKPRVFVSSTYYDLKHIRNSLESFIDSLGYESVLYEDGDIPFHHDKPLDISCYEEIKSCHILVLIIGGRYGSPSSEESEDKKDEKLEYYNSITKKEYETARSNDIPIYIFIDGHVHSEYHTYKKNRNNKNIEYAHVDNVHVFKLIDEIYSQKRNNLIKDFEKFEDISFWLKDQWAGLFADFLTQKSHDNDLSDLSTQISDLKDMNSILKKYTELIMEKIQPENFKQIINESNEGLDEKLIFNFVNDGFVRYLRDISNYGESDEKFYSAFQNSASLRLFLKKLDIDEGSINHICKDKLIRYDFNKLKERFRNE